MKVLMLVVALALIASTSVAQEKKLATLPITRVAKSVEVIREPVPNRGVFGGWAVSTFPLTKEELTTLAKLYETYTSPDMPSVSVRHMRELMLVLAVTPDDPDLVRLFYVTTFNEDAAHPVKAVLQKKAKWHFVEHAEGSESYNDFLKVVTATAKEYGLE